MKTPSEKSSQMTTERIIPLQRTINKETSLYCFNNKHRIFSVMNKQDERLPSTTQQQLKPADKITVKKRQEVKNTYRYTVTCTIRTAFIRWFISDTRTHTGNRPRKKLENKHHTHTRWLSGKKPKETQTTSTEQ